MILEPGELLERINGTPLGRVVSERQLRRLRRDAGQTGTSIDVAALLAYCVELGDQASADRDQAAERRSTDYDRHRERVASAERERSAEGRELGELPDVVDPKRRDRCGESFRAFCESYFPDVFKLAWSPDHVSTIDTIERSVRDGGLFALAMPRGFGKTSLTEAAALWSVLYGRRRFVAIIGADKEAAGELLDSIKVELEENERLAEDFPTVCYPLAAIEGIANRCRGQTHNGERTRVELKADRLVLPTIAGSPASGAIICCRGITGRVRGMKHKRAGDLESARPDLVILDDPQTDESATSPGLTAKRLKTINGAVLGLAGPGRRIAAVMPCTVIAENDLADQLLDRTKFPAWQGRRGRLLYSLPDRLDLWERYAEILADDSFELFDDAHAAATAFYRKHRAAMDKGARAAWPERFEDHQLSAVQFALDLRIADPYTFAAEYQNEPVDVAAADQVERLNVDQIAAKVSPIERGAIPLEATKITAFVDVQLRCLYYLVAAWSPTFEGWVVEYGSFPKQTTRHFVYSAIRSTLDLEYPGASVDVRLRRALDDLSDDLLGRRYKRPDGATLAIERLFVDAGWKTSVVYKFARERGGPITPSHGRGIKASDAGLIARKLQPGERAGLEWLQPLVRRRRAVPHVVFDTNFWKSFFHERLSTPIGERGSLNLYRARPAEHRLIAEHLDAEVAARVTNARTGRTVDEWKLKAGRDNHLFDCAVGSAVAASFEGVELPEQLENAPGRKKRRRVSLSDLQARKRAR